MNRPLNSASRTAERPANLHESLLRILPQVERTQYQNLCPQTCISYPALNLSACQSIKTIITPATDSPRDELCYDPRIGAEVLKKSDPDDLALKVRAQLVGRLISNRQGSLRIHDGKDSAAIIIAPPPRLSLRNAFVYAVNWRYIPDRSKGYFEVLHRDIIILTPRHVSNPDTAAVQNDATLICLSATVTAKSCRIATRKSSCFLVELSGVSNATIVVFRDDAVQWWPFLHVGAQVTVRGLRLCSLPSYNRRTVFLASSATEVIESDHSHETVTSNELRSSKRPRVAGRKFRSNRAASHQLKELVVDYEGLITDILADGRFKLDDRMTFHAGPIHSFTSDMTVSSILRTGTKIKVFNAHLVQRYDTVRLFPTAKSSIEVLYFGELQAVHCSNDMGWRQSGWDRLWKWLDCDDVLWAEEMYDMLATKFWQWLRGSTQQEDQATDRDRIACLLGDQNDVGLVQYVMHLLSGRDDLLNQDCSSRRDIYKEFLEPLALGRNRSQTYASVPTLRQLKAMVLKSRVNSENIDAHPSSSRIEITSVQEDVVTLHHSQIATNQTSRNNEANVSPQHCLVLSGLLHLLESDRNRLAISDATITLPVRIVGKLEPALIGAVILVMDYYTVVDFRVGEHESVTPVFSANAVKIIVDGPYAEMGSTINGPLVCETQSFNRGNKSIGNKLPDGVWSQGSAILTRRAWTQGSGDEGSQHGSIRIADVPLICVFVETVRYGEHKAEICGHLLAVRRSHREESWEVILQDEEARLFWECRITLSGSTAMEVSTVIQENRLWGISCSELSGVDDLSAFIWNKGIVSCSVMLQSTFNRIVPWVEDLGKGEYMRYSHDSITNSPENLSIVSDEGGVYNLVRDTVERLCAITRVKTVLWELYNLTECSVNIRGTVIGKSAWDRSRGSCAEWVLTIRDGTMFTLRVDFRDRKDCIKGIAPGMCVILLNIRCSRAVPWGKCIFTATADTIIRVVSIERGCCACSGRRGIDHVMMRGLPRVDLVELEDGRGVKWVGVLSFDIVDVVEIRLLRRECCGRSFVTMSVTATIEDGTTKGVLRSEGVDDCRTLLNLSEGDMSKIERIAGGGGVTIDKGSAKDYGVTKMFRGGGRFVGAVVCEERVAGGEVLMKCFNVGFGNRLWTACREDVVSVFCVGLLKDGVGWLRERVAALYDADV